MILSSPDYELQKNYMISGHQDVKFLNFLMFCPSFSYVCHSHIHSHLILDPGSACYDDFGGGEAASEVIINGVSGKADTRIHGYAICIYMLIHKMVEIFKRLKNREDSSDFDDF